jgi:hypothetical protein
VLIYAHQARQLEIKEKERKRARRKKRISITSE